MKRSNVNVGTRAEILAELEETGSDRAAQGNKVKAAEYAQAIHAVTGGADVVRVRHSIWVVSDGQDSLSDREIAEAAVYAGSAVPR